jgi:hypothetical protein
VDWEMDDHFKEHLQNLGIVESDDEPGSEFISKV